MFSVLKWDFKRQDDYLDSKISQFIFQILTYLFAQFILHLDWKMQRCNSICYVFYLVFYIGNTCYVLSIQRCGIGSLLKIQFVRSNKGAFFQGFRGKEISLFPNLPSVKISGITQKIQIRLYFKIIQWFWFCMWWKSQWKSKMSLEKWW